MCIGGRLGLEIYLEEDEEPEKTLFGETNGCLLVEVDPEMCSAFEACLNGLPYRQLGKVSEELCLSVIGKPGLYLILLPVMDLVSAWNTLP
jgi:phosphoribosylformylglycinamidine (FGAM) synthase-like enzyme